MRAAERPHPALLRLAGSGKAGPSDELEDQLSVFYAARKFKVIADLTGVAHVSSSVLGVLARFAEECRSHNGELRLVVTESGVTHLLQITMLDKVFEIYSSLEEAEEDF